MKKIIIAFITLSVLSYACRAQEKKNIYTSDLGNYSIEYLGEYTENTKETESANTYKILFKSNSVSYLISGTNHFEDLEKSLEDFLNISINRFIEAIKGKLVEQKDISFGTIKGKYCLLNLPESNVKVELYTYMKGNYHYQLVAYADSESYNQEEANRVFNSFKVLD